MLGQKKLVLFPEIGRVKKNFITHPSAWSNVYQNIYLSFSKNNKQTNKQTRIKKSKKN